MSARLAKGERMNVEEYLAWAERQSDGRYELVDGVPFKMSPERNIHASVKGLVYLAFREAVVSSNLPYAVLTDGPTVIIDSHRSREPDLVVLPTEMIDWNAVTADSPTIIVEVTSPSTMRIDTDDKLIEYFSIASVQHYVLVHPVERKVVHHRRRSAATIETTIVAAGSLTFDPPGFEVETEHFFKDLPPVRTN